MTDKAAIELTKSTAEVYCRLQDDYSRWLYEQRVMWSLSGNQIYVEAITDSLIDRTIFDELMEKAKRFSKRLVIRGAGNDYRVLKRLCPELDFCLFVDNDAMKLGSTVDGKKVISPEEFYGEYADYYVMVNSVAANAEIIEELREHGVKEEQILNLRDCYEKICDKQYFEKEIMKPSSDEVFVDGGCYDGRTVRQFIQWCGGDYEKIYSFEPDPGNFILADRRLSEIRDVKLFNKGLWNENSELHFMYSGSQGARISEGGDVTVQTTTVDEAVAGGKVTFIKLDVEGAEYNALLGARETITRHHPKLAISIYHKPEDIFTLPELILSMNKDYRFWLRHYQLSPNETILYAE